MNTKETEVQITKNRENETNTKIAKVTNKWIKGVISLQSNNNILFKRESFAYYISLLQMNDNRTIVVGLQEIFFNLKMGYILSRYERRILEPLIINIIINNKDDTVRRWAYMVGAFCINKELVRVSLGQLEKEHDLENRTWIIAILAHNLEEDEFNNKIFYLNHGLNEDNIKLAIHLFSTNHKYRITESDIKRIIEKNDKISLFWIGSNAAYSDLARIRRKEIIISNDIVSALTNHDDDEVLKHIMYAYSFKKSFSIKKELKFDYFDCYNMQPHHKKWFLTAMWKDKKFIHDNIEYIKDILNPRHLFLYCDKRIREGLARGLSEYAYESSLVRSVLEWLSYENETCVIHFLLLYILRWQNCCQEYKEIINDELLHGGRIEENLIKTFGLSKNKEKRKENIKERNIFFFEQKNQYIFEKGSNVMRDLYNNTGFVGNQGLNAGKNSVVNQTGGNNSFQDFDGILKEATKLKDYLYMQPNDESTEILIGEITKIQQAAREKSQTKLSNILKETGKEIYSIAQKIGCSLISTYLAREFGLK